jgi:hypothetical protein
MQVRKYKLTYICLKNISLYIRLRRGENSRRNIMLKDSITKLYEILVLYCITYGQELKASGRRRGVKVWVRLGGCCGERKEASENGGI